MVVKAEKNYFRCFCNDLIDYFIVCFEHQCRFSACSLKSSLMVLDEIGVVLGRTFVSTQFATLLRSQKSYRDTIVPVGSSASVL